jgi:F-type H+-transporting ATPase subunit alpha
LFDPVPLEQMTDAGHAVREAAATIPSEVGARFETAAKLSEEDKTVVVEIARKALAPFQPKPEPKPEVKAVAQGAIKVEPKPENNAEAKPKPDDKAKPEVKADPKPKVESPPPAEVKPTAKVEAEAKP